MGVGGSLKNNQEDKYVLPGALAGAGVATALHVWQNRQVDLSDTDRQRRLLLLSLLCVLITGVTLYKTRNQ